MELQYVERGYKEKLLLIPGWATDCRIFGLLDLPYNYLLPSHYSPFNFTQGLREALDRGALQKFSLLGWSMGGFLAADFTALFPARINELLLLGVRKKYANEALREINLKLARNKHAWLYKFYQGLFSEEDAKARDWFAKNLWQVYADSISLEDLVLGLEYLSRAELDPRSLRGIGKIRIFHGEDDAVAPLAEAREFSFSYSEAEFISLGKAGHACFFSPQFKKSFVHE